MRPVDLNGRGVGGPSDGVSLYLKYYNELKQEDQTYVYNHTYLKPIDIDDVICPVTMRRVVNGDVDGDAVFTLDAKHEEAVNQNLAGMSFLDEE